MADLLPRFSLDDQAKIERARDEIRSTRNTAYPFYSSTASPIAKYMGGMAELTKPSPEPMPAALKVELRPIYTTNEWILEEVENHWAALAPYFAFYNFCRIHSSIRVTPAMQAGITDHVWEIDELLA